MHPRIIYLIKRAEIEVTSRMGQALEKFGVTPIQFTVLYFVHQYKGDLSSAQLSRRFAVTPQSMGELIAVLQRKKLLKKAVDPSHKRKLQINLTPKGIQTLDACNTELDCVEAELLASVNAKELTKLRALIGKILNSSRGSGDD